MWQTCLEILRAVLRYESLESRVRKRILETAAMSDPGTYYEQKRQDARRISKLLEIAKIIEVPAATVQMLERQLEGARYVGD